MSPDGRNSCRYTLHQTIIGLELVKQLELAQVEPDVLVGCVGGGTNFFGFVAPYLAQQIRGEKTAKLVAAESANAPALKRGEYRYDFADSFQYTPRYKMYTLGHEFVPPKFHAGGLRYHGKSAILSLMANKKFVSSVAIEQNDAFDAGRRFFLSEGVLPSPETCHAIAAIEQIANSDKEKNLHRDLVFCLSDVGYLDLLGYAKMFELDKQ